MCGIYKITNKVNGKSYIGQSCAIGRRWKSHRNTAFNYSAKNYENYLYRSIRKYGLDNFDFEVIEECLLTELDEKERYWISHFDTFNNGYNLTDGTPTSNFTKIDWAQADSIIDALINTKLSQTEISKEYNLTQQMISEINLGNSWRKDYLTYPLREGRLYGKSQSQVSIHTCLRCGKEIAKDSKHCQECNNIISRTVERPDREELKRLIRTTPFLTIGKQFSVSDNAIRKWCQKEGLPHLSKVIKAYSDKEWELI